MFTGSSLAQGPAMFMIRTIENHFIIMVWFFKRAKLLNEHVHVNMTQWQFLSMTTLMWYQHSSIVFCTAFHSWCMSQFTYTYTSCAWSFMRFVGSLSMAYKRTDCIYHAHVSSLFNESNECIRVKYIWNWIWIGICIWMSRCLFYMACRNVNGSSSHLNCRTIKRLHRYRNLIVVTLFTKRNIAYFIRT